ncbi:MAG: AMP-binding protein, partial [bacterium]|nr:AMP-binding protein [bacterium]
MTDTKNYTGKVAIAANQFTGERDYWLNKLSGELVRTALPYDFTGKDSMETGKNKHTFDFIGDFLTQLTKLSGGSDLRLHMILAAAVVVLLNKYTGNKDIIVGSPIYKQEVKGEFVNTVIALRNRLQAGMTFKELLLQVRETITEADKNRNYPIAVLVDKLELKSNRDEFPLFDTTVMVENVHDKTYLDEINHNVTFSFSIKPGSIAGTLEYSPKTYKKETMARISGHYTRILQSAMENINIEISSLDMLSQEERNQLLTEFNSREGDYPREKTIPQLFEEQVERTPDNIALLGIEESPATTGTTAAASGTGDLTYRELNRRANRMARRLRSAGVNPEAESVVGLMIERSLEMVIAMMAILKAGGAYLPVDPQLPEERIRYILDDSGAEILLTTGQASASIPFSTLSNFEKSKGVEIVTTQPRGPIKTFDQFPRPDRSYLDLRKYNNKIGMASVTNSISIQTTRGCPYECLYCHKIWSKKHVFRSAENIFDEIRYYYENGVTNFAAIDDCFNLNRENSSRLFRLIIKNKLKIQLFFPNGLRGDIMTPDYIDLMAEAGCRGI